MGKDRKLCDWKKKNIARDPGAFAALVLPPRFLCLQCGRVAASEELLCKPRALDPAPGAQSS